MKRCIAAILALLQASTTVWAAPEVDPALPAYHASAWKLGGELHFSGGDTMRPLVESHQGQEAVALDPMGFIPLTATKAAASRRQLE
jgi:hypothetical protein